MTVFMWIIKFITAVGAINWGLTKFFKLNLVEYICSMVKVDYLKEALYGTISICGLYLLLRLFM